MSRVATTIGVLSKLYPYEVDPSDELEESLAFIESPHDAETVVQAGYGAGVFSLVLVLPLLVTPFPFPLVLFVGLAVGFCSIHAIHSGPTLLAAFRRTEALGDTPNLIGRAVLRMQIQPATEPAVRFAADTGFGPLARSLGAHIDRAMGTPRTGLLSFADEWAENFPALRRSAHLLATAESAPPGERGRTLDRSLNAILNGTREQMAEFTNKIRGPTTMLYAFGVMLPMALVALAPALGLANFDISIWFFVFIYDLVLPIVLVGASVWLLIRRPVAFPPPDVGNDHPDVPDRPWLPPAAGVAGGIGGAVVCVLLGVGYLIPVAVIGLSVGSSMLAFFHPIMKVRQYVRNVEEHLTDALYLVGRQVAEGQAVEPAIAHAAERVPAETGEVFEHATGLQRRLHVSVEAAFFGKYGALRNIPSPRAHGTASLLAIAAEEGQPAGRAIVSMADHLEELQEVESGAQRQLSRVTGTLDNTAAFFGPMVAGSTVALANGLTETGGFGDGEGLSAPSPSGGAAGPLPGSGAEDAAATALPVDQLGVVVGVYVLLMSVILTTLSIGLRNGLDGSLVGYYVGRALVSASSIYVVTVFAVSLVMT